MLSYKIDTADCSNDVIARIARWFKKAKPTPTINDLNTQLGVHFEEISEMIDTLTGETSHTNYLLNVAQEAIDDLADHLKATTHAVSVRNSDRENYLDALCDQIVTAVGSGVLLHLDVMGGINEVSDSNDSKFDPATGQPILNEHGKIMKGSAYRKADLARFI